MTEGEKDLGEGGAKRKAEIKRPLKHPLSGVRYVKVEDEQVSEDKQIDWEKIKGKWVSDKKGLELGGSKDVPPEQVL